MGKVLLVEGSPSHLALLADPNKDFYKKSVQVVKPFDPEEAAENLQDLHEQLEASLVELNVLRGIEPYKHELEAYAYLPEERNKYWYRPRYNVGDRKTFHHKRIKVFHRRFDRRGRKPLRKVQTCF